MNFDQTLSYQFAQISTFYKVEIEKQLNMFELHSGQIFILFELWNKDGINQTDLASNLKISTPTVNKMIKSLTKNGFIVISNCLDDGRVKRVYLTPKGFAVRPQIEEAWQQLEEKLLANLTATERLVFSQLIDKLVESLLNPKT